MHAVSKIGLAAVVGILTGVSIQCTDEGALSGVCVTDSNCVLDCSTTDCCRPKCPCDSARTSKEAARIAKQRNERCSDMKMECPPAGPTACDWNSRYRAVCRAGACVAEPIEGGAAPEFRAPELPPQLSVEDPRCRVCVRSGTKECVAYVEWQCEEEKECAMKAQCEAACCDAVAPTEVGLDAAPWAARIAAAAATPVTGVLVFAASASGERLGFIELPGRGVAITDVALPKYKPAATWVDGTSDFLVVADDAIERVSFPSQSRHRVLDDAFRVEGFDVAPNGHVALVSLAGPHESSRLATVQLGSAEAVAVPVPWSASGDENPRWSADGKRVALWNQGVAIVDGMTGRFEGRRTQARFGGAVWHPSGEFLLTWLQDDADPSRSEMVVVTPDRTRYARLGIVSDGSPAIAVSPDGAHLASWVIEDRTQRLELFTLGSSQPDRVAADGHAGVLEWVPLQLAALGVEATKPEPSKP
jgi:hypothetical protein